MRAIVHMAEPPSTPARAETNVQTLGRSTNTRPTLPYMLQHLAELHKQVDQLQRSVRESLGINEDEKDIASALRSLMTANVNRELYTKNFEFANALNQELLREANYWRGKCAEFYLTAAASEVGDYIDPKSPAAQKEMENLMDGVRRTERVKKFERERNAILSKITGKMKDNVETFLKDNFLTAVGGQDGVKVCVEVSKQIIEDTLNQMDKLLVAPDQFEQLYSLPKIDPKSIEVTGTSPSGAEESHVGRATGPTASST